MGTTIVGLWLADGLSKGVVFHVGDSRLYRFRDGRLDQITRDHSLYQAWVDAGRSGDPPNRNIIMRALGIVDDVEAEISVQGCWPVTSSCSAPTAERHGAGRHHHRYPGGSRKQASTAHGVSLSRKPTTMAARTMLPWCWPVGDRIQLTKPGSTCPEPVADQIVLFCRIDAERDDAGRQQIRRLPFEHL